MRNEFSGIINRLFNNARKEGLVQQVIENKTFDGKNVVVKDKEMIFWGSCSYLGLETDKRLKQAAIEAIDNFGMQVSASRAVVDTLYYSELETLLSEIFGKPAILAPTTSLGHISTIPILIGKEDVVILDQKVHNSVQNAVLMLNESKIHVETLSHNRMDFLETRIQILSQMHKKIWYLADGVYSMHGDMAPYADLAYLLNKYPNFHIYVDDAHGLGWAGKHGSGTLLKAMNWHPNIILTSSLAKGFGTNGGVLIFDHEEQKQLIRNCGSSFIFSGPISPPVLAASIASAKILLSDEIYQIQEEVVELINYVTSYSKEVNLPLINSGNSPIFYIGVGKLDISQRIMRFLMSHGHLAMSMGFPAVPMNNSGIRICITRHNTKEEIKELLDLISESLLLYLAEAGQDIEDVYKAFDIKYTFQ